MVSSFGHQPTLMPIVKRGYNWITVREAGVKIVVVDVIVDENKNQN